MLEDGTTRETMRLYIHSKGKHINAAGLANAVTHFWATSGMPEHKNKKLAERTAMKWFHRCGYTWKDLRKGVYKDGHERADVIAYRDNVFLPQLASLEPTFVQFDLIPATDSTPEHIISMPPALPLWCRTLRRGSATTKKLLPRCPLCHTTTKIL